MGVADHYWYYLSEMDKDLNLVYMICIEPSADQKQAPQLAITGCVGMGAGFQACRRSHTKYPQRTLITSRASVNVIFRKGDIAGTNLFKQFTFTKTLPLCKSVSMNSRFERVGEPACTDQGVYCVGYCKISESTKTLAVE